MPIITLTTDFGTSDGYVGAMKGVIAQTVTVPVPVVDIAHDIPRGDIAHGAWVVNTACRQFPAGTIHVVVVDPGVGGARRAVIVGAEHSLYVGPDNGVFGYLEPDAASVVTPKLFAKHIAPTFHGRDLFAPIAAMLASKIEITAGPPRSIPVGELTPLPWGPRPAGQGRIVHIDHFGNLISDLPAKEAGDAIAIHGRRLPLVRTYEDVPTGELLAYVGSQRTVEIAVRDGRADSVLAAPRGTPVVPVPAGSEFR